LRDEKEALQGRDFPSYESQALVQHLIGICHYMSDPPVTRTASQPGFRITSLLQRREPVQALEEIPVSLRRWCESAATTMFPWVPRQTECHLSKCIRQSDQQDLQTLPLFQEGTTTSSGWDAVRGLRIQS
jgi:hypothetical protein